MSWGSGGIAPSILWPGQ